MQHEREHTRNQPFQHRTRAVLRGQHPLCLNCRPCSVRTSCSRSCWTRCRSVSQDRSTPEPRIDLLRRDRRRRQGDVDTDRARRTHRVRRIADQQQAVARPVVDEPDDPFEREKRREVLQPVGELGEDGSNWRTRSATNATRLPGATASTPPVGNAMPAWMWCGYFGSISPRTLSPNEM